jgi:phosphoglycerate dehydrogenase-like enzyme
VRVCIAHEPGRQLMGPLPAGIEVTVAPRPGAEIEFWVPGFPEAAPPPAAFAEFTDLRVVQLLTAGADRWAGRVPAAVTLCDARGVHTAATADWTVTAILAYLREFPVFALAQARGEWIHRRTDEVAGKRVLIVGAGSIGEAVAARLAPFGVSLTLAARRPRPGVHGVEELPRLLPSADVVVLVVPLTKATTGLVDAAFLAALPDGAVLVNASRGGVVDTEALTAELASGRIGAALDVTDPEPLPAGHALWGLPNLLLTPHVAGAVGGVLPRAYALVGDQLRRYAAGGPLENVVVDDY